jgi:pyruvate dehydrogenase E2 component (dihydrolipoamide acetyltransferase)
MKNSRLIAGRPGAARPPAGRAWTSPLARNLAREHGIDLTTASGTGPGGRIVRAGIEDAIRQLGAAQPMPQRAAAAPAGPAGVTSAVPPASAAPAAAATAPAGDAEEVLLSTVRRLTAERPAASAREAPHFCLTVVAGAGELLGFGAQASACRAADVKITVTGLLTKACATALGARPEVSVSWDQTRILRYRHINICVAVAIGDGLIVPVIRDAGRKTLTEIAREAHDQGRSTQAHPGELAGGTFTISNLGMYGIRQFTA